MFKLQRYFSITSAVTLLLFAAGLAYLYRENAVEQLITAAERRNTHVAITMANAIWPEFRKHAMNAGRLDSSALRNNRDTVSVDREIRRLAHGIPVVKVKIYDLNGLTVYSSDPAQIGARKIANPGLISARDGTPSSTMTLRDQFNSYEGYIVDRNLVESYVPVRGSNGRIEGVFELYSDVTLVMSGIQDTTTRIFIGLVLAFGALYAALFLIVRRADRILKRQYVGLEHEIGQRRTAEDRLQKAHDSMEKIVEERTAELRAVLDNANDAIVSIDDTGAIEWFNSSAERIFGYSASEVMGKNVSILMTEEERKGHDVALRQTGTRADSGVIGATKERLGLRSDGTEFPIELSIGKAEFDGRTTFVGIIRDVTDRNRVQEQLAHSQKMEAVGQLTGGVAHEFNNMLTAIGGFSRMAQRDVSDTGRVEKCLGEIVRAADQASALTSQMLTFGRKQEIRPKTLRVADVLADLRSMLQPLINEKIELSVALEDSEACAVADPHQLTQAVLNLAINAGHAMPDGGELVIGSRVTVPDAEKCACHPNAFLAEKYVTAYVSDTGTGMDQETLSRIFEPFFTTKEQGSGTGLGLAMVYGMVDQAGGFIDVASEIGKGTTFTIYLPLAEGNPDEIKDTRKRRKGKNSGGTVLVAEDKESVRELARLALEEIGFTVLTAEDGSKALKVYQEHSGDIDLLLTDVAMPGQNGPELARALREGQPGLKVIYMSGHTAVGGAEHADLGDDSPFLKKPFDPEDLAELVRRTLAA